ncbi:MAG: AmmeMemoRadiSam system protein B [Candidatus Woesearchaeota archaeon]
MSIKKPAVAGMFYPNDKKELENMIKQFLDKVKFDDKNRDEIKNKNIKAIIVPHAGYIYSGQVAAYAYKLIENKKYKRIIIIGPAHTVYITSPVTDGNLSWETPLGMVDIAENDFYEMKEAHVEEHCLEVQIPFLQTVLRNFDIIPLVVGDANPKEVKDMLLPLLDNDTLLVISTDLSHFHDDKECRKIDNETVKSISELDDKNIKEACGEIPIKAIISIAKQKKWKINKLCYTNSGEISGDKERVVGYASFVLYE